MASIKLIENMTTWQGEGPNAGKRVVLLRFKECDRVVHKNPCPYCDTLVKMRISANADYDYEDIQKELDSKKCGMLLTGGEPTYESNFNSTVYILSGLEYPFIDVESNGYQLEGLIVFINSLNLSKNINYMFSPKFFTKEELNKTIDQTNKLVGLMKLNNIFIKIVYDENNPLIEEYLDFLSTKEGINSNVYLMPEGKNKEEILKNCPRVFDACEYYNFNFSGREHIMYDFI